MQIIIDITYVFYAVQYCAIVIANVVFVSLAHNDKHLMANLPHC
jgi:hypothetical protein